MRTQLMRLWYEEEGQDLVEYGLLLTFIFLASMAAVGNFSVQVYKIFSNASTSLS
ncbi:MAG: Flp family type IVb pilin [Terriglobia bacterium]